MELAKAAYDYTANEEGELSFKEGDIITVASKHPSGWWTGSCGGASGTFPSNFTEPYTAPRTLEVLLKVQSYLCCSCRARNKTKANEGDPASPRPFRFRWWSGPNVRAPSKASSSRTGKRRGSGSTSSPHHNGSSGKERHQGSKR
jgi:hypothetical protein